MPETPDSEGPIGQQGAGLGAALGSLRVLGALFVLFARMLRRLFHRDWDGEELVRNLYRMGVQSLPIVAITALFTGGIMVIQAAPIVERYGAHGLLGWGAGFGTLREVGPLLTALMISGRVGANNAAELGSMVVTEQVDALRALAIHPESFLLLPRLMAIVTTLFLSVIFADALALTGAALVGKWLLAVEPAIFFQSLTNGLLSTWDVLHGLSKSIAFGAVIGLCSCHFGVSARGGAPGVGRAVHLSVVGSAAGIFALDYLLSFVIA